MSNQKFYRTKALVLKRVNYADNDKIITFLTMSGKIDMIVKGARRETSKMLMASQPFVLLDVSYLDSGRDLKVMTGVSAVEQYSLSGLEQINVGYGVLGLALLLLENSEQLRLFQLTEQALMALDSGHSGHQSKLVAVWYMLQILQDLGQMPNVRQDTDGQTMTEGRSYYYNLAKHGFSVSQDINNQNDTAVLKVIRYYLNGKSIVDTRPLSIELTLQEKVLWFVQRMTSEALEQDITRLFLGAT